MDGDVHTGEVAGVDVRVRLPRGKLRDDEYAQRSTHGGGASLAGRDERHPCKTSLQLDISHRRGVKGACPSRTISRLWRPFWTKTFIRRRFYICPTPAKSDPSMSS